MEPKKFFGTDGIRGVANQDLTPELAFRVGRAVIRALNPQSNPQKILIGKDPRISSDMLENALIAGILSTGASAYRTGILPTPGVSFLARSGNFDAGIMISASHNPVEDNGIKIFSSEGLKLSDTQEATLENLLHAAEDSLPRPTGIGVGIAYDIPEARTRYADHLKSHFPYALTELRVALDCAHGATAVTAPALFENLGAALFVMGGSPDGSRINVNGGATHPNALKDLVLREKCDLGIAFDGDGDRVIFVTRHGEIFNGDHILASLALHWQKTGKLRGPVVTTLMANFGLEEVLHSLHIPLVRTAVGDRYVFEEMQRQNANLGGEQSGHILMLDESSTGDGCLTALKVLGMLIETNQKLEDLSLLIQEFPQRLVNVRVQKKEQFHGDEKIQKAIEEEALKLQGRGRIVVRPSGTESLVRVMAEGPNAKELDDIVERVAKTIEARLS